jgi:glutathione S-transferase
MAGDLKSDWYTAINPNGRAPALVHVKEDGTSVTVFESAACLLYMASEFDKEHKLSYPIGTPEYWSQLSWVSRTSRALGTFLTLSYSSHGRSEGMAPCSVRQPTSIAMHMSRHRRGRGATRLSAEDFSMCWTSSW